MAAASVMSRDIEMDTTMDLGVDIGCMDLDMEWTWNGHGRGMDMEWTWSGISKMVGYGKLFFPSYALLNLSCFHSR